MMGISRFTKLFGYGILAFWLMGAIPLLAQKHDYQWMFNSFWLDTNAVIDFNDHQTLVKKVVTPIKFSITNTNVTMSDREGRFQFATNGCFIVGPDLEIMENGNRINDNAAFSRYCRLAYTNGHQSMLALPDPANDNAYYLVHNSLYDALDSLGDDAILLTKIDMSSNNGLGKVLWKNKPLIADSSTYGASLTAVKHSDGQSWWVFNPLLYENAYARFLIDSTGVHGPYFQNIGRFAAIKGEWGGAAQFTPDGKKYIRWHARDGTFIFDVDRTTGLLSNFQWIDNRLDTTYLVYAGMAVSPNSRFLYLSNLTEVHQYDLHAGDILASKVLVGTWDPSVRHKRGGTASIWAGQLGPDCRIYFTSTSGVDKLHVIHYPNRKGTACDFRVHSFQLPDAHAGSLPHYPNYRLDSGPVCDSSIVLNTRPRRAAALQPFTLYPNPAHSSIFIETSATYDLVEISDLQGRVWLEHRDTGPVAIDALLPGMYIVRLHYRSQFVGVQKLVVQ
jgi:hypothetical protein